MKKRFSKNNTTSHFWINPGIFQGAKAGNSQVLLAVAMKRAEAGHKKEATELLQWWLEYIDGETHAALRPPVAAYLKKLKTPSPTEPSEHLQRLQKLLEPVKGQVNPPN